MPLRLLIKPLYNMAESIYDSCRDHVEPELGSVLYCDLAFGYMEHSGIYVGNNEIVQLNRSGVIECVSPKKFVSGGSACNIYVSCDGLESVGSSKAANRAVEMIGKIRGYNFIFDNCHQFTAGCLTGDFDNSKNFLWMMKQESEEVLGSDNWRYWDIDLL